MAEIACRWSSRGSNDLFVSPLFGEGYNSLRYVLGGDPLQLAEHSFVYPYRNEFWVFAGYLLLILLLKVYAMAFTNGSGG